MHATADVGPRPRRRPKTWKIVVLAVLGLALLEPIVMYTVLERERAHRESLRSRTEVITTQAPKR